MSTNPRFVTTKTLEELFIDRTTGERLAGGFVYFFKDEDRLVPKDVYQITGAPPNYSFIALPNPIELSNIGTIQNSPGGDNVPLYYLPFVSATSDIPELYYVVVRDSLGNMQFVREGWPDTNGTSGSSVVTDGTIINEISNSQFIDVVFTGTLTIPYTGNSVTTMNIGADWDIVITHSDTGSLTIVRNAIPGSTSPATNPPYTLSITAGANITTLKLRQRFSGNPDIWTPKTAGQMGYVNGGVLLGTNTSVVMRYEPSVGSDQSILDTTNSTAATAYANATVQLTPGNNTAVGGVGYVDITLQLNATSSFVSTISSVQLVGLEANQNTVAYKQDTINRQNDYLAHYYKPLLAAKPIASYLDAWDFALNPHQVLTATVAASSTAPGFSKYVWDQTILFQSQDSAIGVTQSSTGAIVLTNAAVSATRAALIQYQEGLVAREILNSRLSSMVRAFASASITATISLWYTTDASLPVLTAGTSNSIVQTLDANGKPATFNGTWVEVPRLPVEGGTATLQNAAFTIGTSADTNFNEYGFSGWDMQGIAAVGTATFFAIVVGTGDIASAGTVSIESISLVPGDMPTRPAAQSVEQVQHACEYYFEKSFETQTVPATGVITAYNVLQQVVPASTGCTTPQVSFKTRKRTSAYGLTIYNPVSANNEIRNFSTGSDFSATASASPGTWGFHLTATSPGGSGVGQTCGYHWAVDARLGLF